MEGIHRGPVPGDEGHVNAGRGLIAFEDPEVIGIPLATFEPEAASSLDRVEHSETQGGKSGLVEATARTQVSHPERDVVYNGAHGRLPPTVASIRTARRPSSRACATAGNPGRRLWSRCRSCRSRRRVGRPPG